MLLYNIATRHELLRSTLSPQQLGRESSDCEQLHVMDNDAVLKLSHFKPIPL